MDNKRGLLIGFLLTLAGTCSAELKASEVGLISSVVVSDVLSQQLESGLELSDKIGRAHV